MREDIASIRQEYTQASLDESSVDMDPLAQFEKWFQEALDSEVLVPNAMVLGTVDPAGRPYQRTVLLKSYDTRGFVFYTNLESRKGRQIAACPITSSTLPMKL